MGGRGGSCEDAHYLDDFIVLQRDTNIGEILKQWRKNEAKKCSCLWSNLGQTGAVAATQDFSINWLGHL
jgi:hypothetical protein